MPDAVSSPFGTLAVIVNPLDGHGRVGDEVPALERALAERDLDYRLTVATERLDAMRAATDALDGGTRFVVAVGDDATVQDVVNGMFRDGSPIVSEPVLGVLAATGGNELVRSFGMPRDTAGGVQRLLGESVYPMDVMKVSCRGTGNGGEVTRYAANVVQLGLAAHVSLRRDRLPGWLGERGRSFLGFWAGYVAARRRELQIAYDTKTWKGGAFQVIVGNAQYAAGGLRMSPRSWPGDGVLDALVFTGNKSDAYTMMPRILRHGEHLPDPNITELRAKIRFAIDATVPLPVVADGVALGTTPLAVQIVPQQILFKL